MSGRLLLQTWRWQALKLAIVTVALVGWGVLIPIIYAAFTDPLRQALDAGLVPEEIATVGSGDLLSLSGAVALGLQHPLFIALAGVFGVGLASTVIAGDRQRGTLEVLLARPISRRGLYITLAVALAVLIAIPVAATLAGMLVGAELQGLGGEIDAGLMPLVWLNGFLLWAAFASFGLAASASFSRSGPALALTLAYIIVAYFFEVLGSLWDEAAFLQDYSLFHHFQAKEILAGQADPFDFALLAALALLPLVYALFSFPRRDIPAPA